MALFKFLGSHLESSSFGLFWLLETDNIVRRLRRLRCNYLLFFGGDFCRFRPWWVNGLQLILLEGVLDPLSHLWKLMIGLGLWNHSIIDRLCSSLHWSNWLLLFTPLFRLFMSVQIGCRRSQLLQKVCICLPKGFLEFFRAFLLWFYALLPIVIHLLHVPLLERLQVLLSHPMLHRFELMILGRFSLPIGSLLGRNRPFLGLGWRLVKKFHIVDIFTARLLLLLLFLSHIVIVKVKDMLTDFKSVEEARRDGTWGSHAFLVRSTASKR